MEISTNINVMPPLKEIGVGSPAGGGQASSVLPNSNSSVNVSQLSSVPGDTSATTTVDAVAAAKKTEAAKQAALQAAMNAGNKSMQQLSPSLEFQIDPDTKQTVVRVVDTTNNEVIKQIPSAQFLRISSAIEGLQQHILDEKA